MQQNLAVVGHGLISCTAEVQVFACYHPDRSGRKFVLVDTPGFNDTEKSDYQVLKTVAKWLEQT
jgi:hypothetical protein